jgi:septin family protein
VLHGAGQTNKFRLKEKIMFTYDTLIDAVQTGKKQFVNTFVQNEAVKNAMVTFIDAQADYTKKAVKVGTDTASVLTSEFMKASQEAMKFDYSKFGEGFGKAFSAAKK